MFKFNLTAIIGVLVITLASFLLLSNVRAANLSNAFENDAGPLSTVSDKAGYDNQQTDINPIISTVIETALSMLGVVFLGLLIYGGYEWMTAMGDSAKVEKAQNIIKAAIIGLVIVVSAYAISIFVLKNLSKTTLKADTSAPATP